jgi:hypothetical protein
MAAKQRERRRETGMRGNMGATPRENALSAGNQAVVIEVGPFNHLERVLVKDAILF